MTKSLKQGLLATATAGALLAGLSLSPAMATPLPFEVTPTSVGSVKAPFIATDASGISSAIIRQIGPTTQEERGWVVGTGLSNNGVPIFGVTSGLGTDWNFYIKFIATVNGVTGITPGQSGTIAADGFQFAFYVDPGTQDNTYNNGVAGGPGPYGATGGTDPTVVDVAGDDVLIGIGNSLFGTAGFNNLGTPQFTAFSTFLICNGTAGSGNFEGNPVAASNTQGTCGTFDGRTFFTDPDPFYSFDFASAIPAGPTNFGDLNLGPPPNILLVGINSSINFQTIPEPMTIGLIGASLLGLGIMRRRKA